MIKKPLLAGKADIDKIKYPVLASPKFDGIRCLIVDGQAVSRTFKPIPNKFIREMLKGLPDGVDGELMLADQKATFQQVTSAVMSFDGQPDFYYYVFDYVKNGLEEPYKQRLENVSKLTGKPISPIQLKLVKGIEVKDEKELLELEKLALESGFEGVMIRDPNGPYKCGRSTTNEGILLKIKRFEDAEAVITGFEEKQINQNEQTKNELGYSKRSTAKAGMVNADTLGNFIVMDTKSGIEFRVGSGLNDSTRTTIWQNRSAYLNKIIKYKYQAIGVKDAPRTPIFLGFRDPIDI